MNTIEHQLKEFFVNNLHNIILMKNKNIER